MPAIGDTRERALKVRYPGQCRGVGWKRALYLRFGHLHLHWAFVYGRKQ